MSRMPNKNKKRTTRIRNKKEGAGTVDDDNEDVANKDAIMTPAEKAVRSVVSWIAKTQASSGGMSEWYAKNVLDVKGSEVQSNTAANGGAAKNRNLDLPCIETTRVKLKSLPDGAKDYIHANYIKTPHSDRTYIATQHPLESTYEDFWRMVFYENVDTIVALYTADEDLPHYFPNEAGKFGNYGVFFVNNRKATPPTAKFAPTTHQIEVLPEGCSNSRIVTILHYQYWPKNQFPQSPRVIMKTLRLVKVDKSTNGPVVVHCANGINRAGCFIMSDIIIDITFRNVDPEIPKLIKTLRGQRANFVPNKQFLMYTCNVFMDYVRIRCKKFNLFSDVLKEIDTFQAAVHKEIAANCGKEPAGKKKDATIDE